LSISPEVMEGNVGNLELRINLVEIVHYVLSSTTVREVVVQVVAQSISVDLVVAEPLPDVINSIHR